MPVYEVTRVAPEPRSWTAQGKYPMLEYRIDLKGPNSEGAIVDVQNVEWSRKAESPAPKPGQRLNVEKFEDRGPRGLKLHLVQQQTPTGSYGPRNGSSRDFRADPVKQAAIAAESAQKVAVDTIRLAIETKQDPAEMAQQVVEVSRVLLEQIKAAMSEADK
jgi:hypothetical protein